MQFELFYPCKPYGINQLFGVNGQYYRDHGIMIDGHNGMDLSAKHGQPIYAAHDGIAFYEIDSSQGHGVVLITNGQFDYKGGQCFFKTIYWHMVDYHKEPMYKSPVVAHQETHMGEPMPVKRGQIIGYADSTGFSGGDHLHFGLKPIRPGKPLSGAQDAVDVGIGNWVNLEQNNGYLGAINPMPYLNGIFAQDGLAAGLSPEEYANAIKDKPNAPTPGPDEAVEALAAKEASKGNMALAERLRAIVAVIRAFLGI